LQIKNSEDKNLMHVIRIILFWFTLFWTFFFISTSNSYEYRSDRLQIKFDKENAKLLYWKVLNDSMSLPHELVKENKSNFELEGTIDGHTLEYWAQNAGGWNINQNLDEIIFELKSDNIPFELKKYWKFYPNSYQADLSFELYTKKNLKNIDLHLNLGPGIGEKFIDGLGISGNTYSFTEFIYNTGNVQTKKIENKDEVFLLDKIENPKWVGLHSRYFLFILKTNDKFSDIKFYINNVVNEKNISLDSKLKIFLPVSSLKKNNKHISSFQLFGGTKTKSDLSISSLDNILFESLWSWMRYIVLGIMTILYWINSFVFNWGISIIILSILVRIVIHPIAKKSMQSQQEFAKLQNIIQPQIKEIKKNFKGGEQSERILNIYEKYNTSPLASFKPMLGLGVQIPIFIALFHLLGQTFELKEASFLWIESLAAPDKFFSLGRELPFFGSYFNLLPVLMSLTNLLSIKISSVSSTEGKTPFGQNVSLGLMTLGFFLLFYSFPSGMVLYWTMANILHLTYCLFTIKKKSV
jgi:YidC/Oxa1 family membrane protein insertase